MWRLQDSWISGFLERAMYLPYILSSVIRSGLAECCAESKGTSRYIKKGSGLKTGINFKVRMRKRNRWASVEWGGFHYFISAVTQLSDIFIFSLSLPTCCTAEANIRSTEAQERRCLSCQTRPGLAANIKFLSMKLYHLHLTRYVCEKNNTANF